MTVKAAVGSQRRGNSASCGSRRPRVLQIVTKADLGGTQVHVLDLLRGLRSEFEMVLATGERGFFTEQATAIPIECHLLEGLVQQIRPLSDLKALISAVRLIRKVRPDIIHCHTTKAGLIGRLAARLLGIPAIYTVHTWCFTDGTSRSWRLLGRPCERLAGGWARQIITVSDANRAAGISRHIANPRKFVTIHNGIDDSPFRSKPGVVGTPRIVMVARFVKQKNHQLLIEAVSRVGHPLTLTLVGDGPLHEAARRLAVLCPPHVKIELLGERRDVAEILAASHLFVLSTNWEGFPISILEAMRAGLPVIATNVDGVQEAVTDGESGLLVRPRDLASLEGALKKLTTDAELRKRMGSRGRRIYEERFSIAAMLQRTSAVYQETLRQFWAGPRDRRSHTRPLEVPLPAGNF